ncbi:unnamed protein product, partial [marine sediment metagenome]
FSSLEKRLVNLKDKINFKKETPGVKKRADKINLKHLTGGLNLEILNKNITKKIYITEFAADDVFYGIILYSGLDSAYLIERDSLNEGAVKKTVKKLLENNEIKKSGFDFKRIYKILKDYGICLRGKFIDYKILYLILNPVKSTTTLDEITGDLLSF